MSTVSDFLCCIDAINCICAWKLECAFLIVSGGLVVASTF